MVYLESIGHEKIRTRVAQQIMHQTLDSVITQSNHTGKFVLVAKNSNILFSMILFSKLELCNFLRKSFIYLALCVNNTKILVITANMEILHQSSLNAPLGWIP